MCSKETKKEIRSLSDKAKHKTKQLPRYGRQI
jgi:hypothetical protein